MNANTADDGRLAYDHLQIADALYRYCAGLDEKDAALLASAFTADAIFDSRAGAKLFGVESTAVKGRDAIVAMCTGFVAPLDTSHSVSNIRILIDGDTASAQARQVAQHYPAGEGTRLDRSRRLLMENRLDFEAVRDGGQWRLHRLTIDNAWGEGDVSVIMPAAQQAG